MGKEAEAEQEFASPEDRGDFLESEEDTKVADDAKDEPTQEEIDALKNDDGKKDDKDDGDGDSDDSGDAGGASGDSSTSDDDKDDTKDDTKVRGIRVPKFRLDAALARAREAESELEEMRNTKAKEPAASTEKEPETTKTPLQELDEKQEAIDTKIVDALADGDSKLVNQLRGESRTLEREFNRTQTELASGATQTQTQAQVLENGKLDSVLDQLEEAFPIFNEAHKDFDADANAYVLRLQNNFIKGEGMSPSEALVEAVNVAIPALGLETEPEGETDTSDSKKDDKVPGKPEGRVKENIDASKRTPPDTSDIGDDANSGGMLDSDPSIMDLTDAEFDALPEETKKRMRGDFD